MDKTDEELKKHMRTQGKYFDKNKIKGRDKRQKISPAFKQPPEKKNNRNSNGNSLPSNSITDSISPVKYEENSSYSFDQLEEPKKAIEITDCGKHVLSETDNGESVILYEQQFLDLYEGNEYYDCLLNTINWYSKNIVINGEEYPQPRLVAWFGPYPYSYSGATLEPKEMPDTVLEIKTKVEEYLSKKGIEATFNSVLLNLYRNGKDSVAWHSDDELTMGICPTIASVSLGETRKFEMRPKRKYFEDENPVNKQSHYFVHLTHGSLLIMDGSMQDDWQHRVPKEYHDRDERVNLTFRTVYPLEKIPHKDSEREVEKKYMNNWNTVKTSSSHINFDDFPPLNSDVSPSVSNAHESFDSPLRKDKSSEIWDIEASFDEKSNTEMDVSSSIHESSSSSLRNDDLNKSSEIWDSKMDMLNYDHPSDSSTATDVKYSRRSMDENDSSFEISSVENRFSDSLPSDVTKECSPPKNRLNALAKEFVPINVPTIQLPDYSSLPLEELVNCDVSSMAGENLQNFTQILKHKVKERIYEFNRFAREELEFLCAITDGAQTEKNQKLITSRIASTVIKFSEKSQSSPNSQSYSDRHSRSHSYGKSNHPIRGNRFHVNQGSYSRRY